MKAMGFVLRHLLLDAFGDIVVIFYMKVPTTPWSRLTSPTVVFCCSSPEGRNGGYMAGS